MKSRALHSVDLNNKEKLKRIVGVLQKRAKRRKLNNLWESDNENQAARYVQECNSENKDDSDFKPVVELLQRPSGNSLQELRKESNVTIIDKPHDDLTEDSADVPLECGDSSNSGANIAQEVSEDTDNVLENEYKESTPKKRGRDDKDSDIKPYHYQPLQQQVHLNNEYTETDEEQSAVEHELDDLCGEHVSNDEEHQSHTSNCASNSDNEPVNLDKAEQESSDEKEENKQRSQLKDNCRICNKDFSSALYFIKHLKNVHSITAFHMEMPDLPPPLKVEERLRCGGCEYSCTTRNAYRKHVKAYHSIVATGHKSKEPQFYASNPNNHCIACCQTEGVHDAFHVQTCVGTYNSEAEYVSHLLEVHEIKAEKDRRGHKRDDVMPDPLDVNHYCKSCEKLYEKRSKYTAHLRCVHKLYCITA